MRPLTKKAQKLIQAKESRFPEWSLTNSAFKEVFMDSMPVDIGEEGWELMNRQHRICMELMGIILNGSSVYETWDMPTILPLPLGGVEIIFRANRVEGSYKFGMDREGFYLESLLDPAEGIRKMNDRFWLSLAELDNMGKLEYHTYAAPESWAIRQSPYLHRRSKSAIFSIIQNALYEESENGIIEVLGVLQIRWKYGTPWEEILTQGIHALNTLYYLNKALWSKRDKSRD